METNPPRRFWIPAFATERGVRIALQCLYVGLVGSSLNARNLVEHDPLKLDYAAAAGNSLTKGCFTQVTRWLSRVNEFAVNEEVFQKQILEAVRAPARFLLTVREERPSTTTVSGLVFAKSAQFYDKYYQSRVVDLALICPDLGTSMSLRYRSEVLGGTEFGLYEFTGVQPIPLVNRIHPFDLGVKKVGQTTELRRLHQFKSSWGDFPEAARSWNFENYAQIQCTQTGRKRLGIACVLSGKIMGLSIPRMILQSPIGEQKSTEVALTESVVAQYGGDEARMRTMIGKPVRLLVVFWYGHGFSRANPTLPEAFLMEEAGSMDEVRLDDAIGFVRARRRVSEQKFLSRYTNQELMALPPELIKAEHKLLEWVTPPTTRNRILDAFIDQERALADSRIKDSASGESRPLLLSDVIDSRKLDMERLSQITSADAKVSEILLLLITSEDSGLIWDHWSDIVRGVGGDPSATRGKLRWLRDMSLIAKKEGGVQITSRGKLVWYSANRNPLMASIEKFLAGKSGKFDLLQAAKIVSFPMSMIVAGLDELGRSGKVKCLQEPGREFRLFWKIEGGERDQSNMQMDTPMIEDILAVLGAAPYSLSTQKILGQLRESDGRWNERILLSTLSYLRSQGRVSYEREQSGNEMWLYPRERRTSDLFSRHPERPFTFEEIVKANHGSPAETLRILQDLATKGQVTRFGAYWFTGDWTKATENALQSLCDKLVRQLVRENGGLVSEARLIYELNHFLAAEAEEFRLQGNVRQLSEKAIQTMVECGKIVRNGTNYGLGPG